MVKQTGVYKYMLFSMFVCGILVSASYSNASNYQIDPAHSQVIFKVKHLGISTVSGRFDNFEGVYNFDDAIIENSSVEAKINAVSVNTNKEKRDKHLRSDEFLDVEEFPEITFKSKSIKKGPSEGKFQIIGDLTIHGITKEVVLDANYEGSVDKDPWGNARSAFTAETEINRKDYGLTWNKMLETGQFLVGNQVKIVLEVEGIRTK